MTHLSHLSTFHISTSGCCTFAKELILLRTKQKNDGVELFPVPSFRAQSDLVSYFRWRRAATNARVESVYFCVIHKQVPRRMARQVGFHCHDIILLGDDPRRLSGSQYFPCYFWLAWYREAMLLSMKAGTVMTVTMICHGFVVHEWEIEAAGGFRMRVDDAVFVAMILYFQVGILRRTPA